MRSLGRVEHLVAGAVGPPGDRAFFIEVEGPEGLEFYLAEKQQVAALAERAVELLRTAGVPLPDPGPRLGVPDEPVFRVGEIGLGIDDDEAVLLLSPAEQGPDPVAFQVPLEVLGAMARRALAVVAAGRPTCRFCGLPEDPEGHACPSSNGDQRSRP